jgi:hypothetical protein
MLLLSVFLQHRKMICILYHQQLCFHVQQFAHPNNNSKTLFPFPFLSQELQTPPTPKSRYHTT